MVTKVLEPKKEFQVDIPQNPIPGCRVKLNISSNIEEIIQNMPDTPRPINFEVMSFYKPKYLYGLEQGIRTPLDIAKLSSKERFDAVERVIRKKYEVLKIVSSNRLFGFFKDLVMPLLENKDYKIQNAFFAYDSGDRESIKSRRSHFASYIELNKRGRGVSFDSMVYLKPSSHSELRPLSKWLKTKGSKTFP